MVYHPVFSKLANHKIISSLSFYSYEVYLIHYLFVQGCLTTLHISKFNLFNILLSVVLSLFAAFLVKSSSTMIEDRLKRRLQGSGYA